MAALMQLSVWTTVAVLLGVSGAAANGDFCCTAAEVESDPCGTCWPSAIAREENYCGQSESQCNVCGKVWCKESTLRKLTLAQHGAGDSAHFCCTAAQNSSDTCGTCWPTATLGMETWCGSYERRCDGCGGTWCGAGEPALLGQSLPLSLPAPLPTPAQVPWPLANIEWPTPPPTSAVTSDPTPSPTREREAKPTSTPTPSPSASPTPSPTQEPSKPYDCDAGGAKPNTTWSKDKKAWCCENEEKGCATSETTTSKPFDCLNGLAKWSWSEAKKLWCCENEGKGCEAIASTETNTTMSTTTTASVDAIKSTEVRVVNSTTNATAGSQSNKELGGIIANSSVLPEIHDDTSNATTTSKPFDCNAGLAKWKTGWSNAKKQWCCDSEQKGCQATTTTKPNASAAANPTLGSDATWSTEAIVMAPKNNTTVQVPSKSDQTGTATNLSVLPGLNDGASDVASTSKPFDCKAGLAKWKTGWSQAKKLWCCDKEERGCEESRTSTTSKPFDCVVGLFNWKTGWSKAKKRWCCDNEETGCEATSNATNSTGDLPPLSLITWNCTVGLGHWQSAWSKGKWEWCCQHHRKLGPALDCEDAQNEAAEASQVTSTTRARTVTTTSATTETASATRSSAILEHILIASDASAFEATPSAEKLRDIASTSSEGVHLKESSKSSTMASTTSTTQAAPRTEPQIVSNITGLSTTAAHLAASVGIMTKSTAPSVGRVAIEAITVTSTTTNVSGVGAAEKQTDATTGNASTNSADAAAVINPTAWKNTLIEANSAAGGLSGTVATLTGLRKLKDNATVKPHDCEAGLAKWQTGWSKAKKQWCCVNGGKGCEGNHTAETTTTSASATTGEDASITTGANTSTGASASTETNTSTQAIASTKISTTTVAHVTTGDTTAGTKTNATVGAAPGKDANLSKLPEHNGTAAGMATTSKPFDCAAGLAKWRTGWSKAKKRWCCDNEETGCEARAATSATSTTSDSAKTSTTTSATTSATASATASATTSATTPATTSANSTSAETSATTWANSTSAETSATTSANSTTSADAISSTGVSTLSSKTNASVGTLSRTEQEGSAANLSRRSKQNDTASDMATTSKPFDCKAGLAKWKAGWSNAKKQWCCENEEKGCEVNATTKTITTTSANSTRGADASLNLNASTGVKAVVFKSNASVVTSASGKHFNDSVGIPGEQSGKKANATSEANITDGAGHPAAAVNTDAGVKSTTEANVTSVSKVSADVLTVVADSTANHETRGVMVVVVTAANDSLNATPSDAKEETSATTASHPATREDTLIAKNATLEANKTAVSAGSEDGFCCMVSGNQSDPCGTCWPGSRAGADTECGRSMSTCESIKAGGCGRTWCPARGSSEIAMKFEEERGGAGARSRQIGGHPQPSAVAAQLAVASAAFLAVLLATLVRSSNCRHLAQSARRMQVIRSRSEECANEQLVATAVEGAEAEEEGYLSTSLLRQ